MAKGIPREDYTVITAQDGEEAWDKIQRESPDIIPLDLMINLIPQRKSQIESDLGDEGDFIGI